MPTLVVICTIRDPVTGESYSRDAHHIAQKAEAYLKETGVGDTAYFGPELEHFVFDGVRYDQGTNYGFYEIKSHEANWDAGEGNGPSLGHKLRPKEGYFPIPPADTLQDARTEMVLLLEKLGIPVEAHHHEVATGGQGEVVVFGGGGFLGRRLVHRLTTEGMSVRVAVRHPDRARIELRSMGFDRVTVVPADVRDQASVSAAVAGANAVVNMVSAYVEKGGVTFEAVHVQGAETVARETVAAGVPRLVLVSGIGADADLRSPYIRARGRGEQVVQQTFPEATIVRPGAMFGPGDALFGTLAELARRLPILPLIGGGSTRLQPVFVEDVAEAIVSILTDPTTVGRTYELAGPGVYTLRELVSMTLHLLRKRRLLIPVPFAVAEIQALLFELLPNPPLTTGQVDLLKADNVTSGALPGLRELNIQPKTVEEVVPTYIGTRAPH